MTEAYLVASYSLLEASERPYFVSKLYKQLRQFGLCACLRGCQVGVAPAEASCQAEDHRQSDPKDNAQVGAEAELWGIRRRDLQQMQK